MKRAYFDELAARWDTLPGPPDAGARVERFLSAALPANCRRVLDAGCGTGILAEAILRRAPSVELLVELDFAHAMLVENRRKRGEGAAYVCADAGSPPLAEGSLDAVLCFNVLPHVQPLEGALKALLAALRPGGRLAVGHMLASAAVTNLHATIGGVVGGDRLPPAAELAGQMAALGARVIAARDGEDGYLVLAEKPE